MKKGILLALVPALMLGAIALGTSSFSKPKRPKGEINVGGKIWQDTMHDFGTVKMGPELIHTFTFKNKSPKVVTILSAEPGCSCTVSEFTKDPIAKNGKGSVTAKYGTNNRQGFFKKFIKVTFDDHTYQSLVITGTVVAE